MNALYVFPNAPVFPPALLRLRKVVRMLYWAAVFFVIAMVAALFGFGGIAGASVDIAKILFFVFLIMAVFSLLVNRHPPF